MKPATFAIAAVLAAFAAFSTWVVVQHGYFGFITLAGREPWALQILIDLTLALFVANAWLVRDARQRGLTAWPFVVGSVALGSISVLVYLVYRGLTDRLNTTRGSRAAVG